MPWPLAKYPELAPRHVAARVEEDKSVADDNRDYDYDYIVVGGGTAGCVLASRLSEDPSVKVLLVERGVLNDTWASRVPLISSDFVSAGAPVYKWKSAPNKDADGREIELVAGKVLGGTSRLNSLLYTRGAPAEWNGWSETGRRGWSFEEMLPFFKKSEKASTALTGEHHGREGPWLVRALPPGWIWSFWPYVAKAAESLGLPSIPDVNSPSGPILGHTPIHRTMDPQGRRHAISAAFLPLSLVQDRKDRLKICTGTLVTKLDVKEDEHRRPRAVGVFVQSEKGKDQQVYYARATKEIVVCSGTFGSPHILQLSGIGPKDHLEKHRIVVKKDLPGVGDHLMDHAGVPLAFKTQLKDSLHAIQASPRVAIGELVKYIFGQSGFFLMPIAQLVMLARSSLLSDTSELVLTKSATDSEEEVATDASAPELDATKPVNIPDLEIIPVPLDCNPASVMTTREGVLTFLTILVQPKSVGTVRLSSASPRDLPTVDLNLLSAPEDIMALRKGLRFAFTIAQKMRDEGYGSLEGFYLPEKDDDATLDAWIRANATTQYHYSSTCRMAPEAEGGVVDDELRVHGIDGLRVADASIFPTILATHTQAPTVAVAEKCADMMKRTA